jgi:hypothetical protein
MQNEKEKTFIKEIKIEKKNETDWKKTQVCKHSQVESQEWMKKTYKSKKKKMKQKLKHLHLQGKNWHPHNRNSHCYILLSKKLGKLEYYTNIMLQDISNIEIPHCLFKFFFDILTKYVK